MPPSRSRYYHPDFVYITGKLKRSDDETSDQQTNGIEETDRYNEGIGNKIKKNKNYSASHTEKQQPEGKKRRKIINCLKSQ